MVPRLAASLLDKLGVGAGQRGWDCATPTLSPGAEDKQLNPGKTVLFNKIR